MSLLRTRTRFINRHYRVFKKMLKAQVTPVIDYLANQSHEHLDSMMPVLIDKKAIEEAYVGLYRDVGVKFKTVVTKGMEEDIWADMMEGWCLRDCANRISEVYNYTIEQVKDIVRKEVDFGTKQGLSIRDISDNIRKKLPREYTKTATWRAKRIAQTEVISASNMSNLEAAKQTGMPMRKRWSTRPYGSALSIQGERHAILTDLESQNPGLNEPFIVDGEPLMYPGDPAGRPGNVINCHCVLTYETI